MPEDIKIALLGFTQTGKTCIAANFASRNGFHGIDSYSQNFLTEHAGKISKMRNGDMSDPFPANLPGKPDVLRFHDAQNNTDFTFEEYAGEMLIKESGAIDKLDIPGKDGVLLLLSAREPICGDAQSIEQRKSEVKESFADIVTELRANPKPIIFVITAADALLDNSIDHSCFFELKKYVEERILRNKLEIAETRFVTIIEKFTGRKIFDQSGNETGIISSAENAVVTLVERIKNEKNIKAGKKMKKTVFTLLLIAALVAAILVACGILSAGDDCAKCKNSPCTCSVLSTGNDSTQKICDECNITKTGDNCIACEAKEIFGTLGHGKNDHEVFINTAAKYFAKELKNPDYNKKYFDNLRSKCLRTRVSIDADDDSTLKRSKIYEFAKEYIEYCNASITVQIDTFKFKRDRSAKGNILISQCFLHIKDKKNSSQATVDIDKKALEHEQSVTVNTSITVKPWETPMLWISGLRYNVLSSGARGTESFPFNPHIIKEKFDCALPGSGLAYLDVYFTITSGRTFPDFLNRIFGTPTPDEDAIKDAEEE